MSTAYAHTSHTTKATIVSTQPTNNMSQPTDMSQPTNMSSHPMPNPYTINPDRNMENMDMDRNPRNMDSNLMDKDRIPQSTGDRDLKNMDKSNMDRNLKNMDTDSGIQSNRYPQSTDMNQNMNPDMNRNMNPDINRNMNSDMNRNINPDMNRNMSPNMNQNMDVNRGTQAPTNESILERDFVNEPRTHSGERIQGADTTMSTDRPEATRQGDVGYNPALFPEGWNSQDKSTWSAEEKLKAKIPGTKEHKIQSNLKKLEKNENLNQGQMDQILNRDQNGNQDQNLNRDDLNRDHLNRDNLNRDQNLDRDQIDRQNQDFSSEHHKMTTGEKIKAAIPGTKEHKIKKAEKQAEKEDEKMERRQNEHLDQEIRQEQDNGFKPKDQMTTGEKIKAVIPGTKEHRAKKAIEKGDQPVV